MGDLYGWELLCMTSADTINSKENAMIGFLHWTITKSGYRCIGLGPEKDFDSAAYGSETLPTGWNLTGGDCSLKYIRKGELYVLRSIRTDESMVVNFMRSRDKEVSSVLFNIEECIAATRGTLEEMVPMYKSIVDKIRNQLITPVGESTTRHAETQTTPASKALQDKDEAEAYPFYRGPPHRDPTLNWDPIHRLPPSNIGRNDLDPLAGVGHGGGMVFNPFGEGRRGIRDPGLGIPGGLPRGAVPPGARFDPFGPLGGRHNMPNPDHMPPPGYGDMFM